MPNEDGTITHVRRPTVEPFSNPRLRNPSLDSHAPAVEERQNSRQLNLSSNVPPHDPADATAGDDHGEPLANLHLSLWRLLRVLTCMGSNCTNLTVSTQRVPGPHSPTKDRHDAAGLTRAASSRLV